jgi:hypothetical protein
VYDSVEEENTEERPEEDAEGDEGRSARSSCAAMTPRSGSEDAFDDAVDATEDGGPRGLGGRVRWSLEREGPTVVAAGTLQPERPLVGSRLNAELQTRPRMSTRGDAGALQAQQAADAACRHPARGLRPADSHDTERPRGGGMLKWIHDARLVTRVAKGGTALSVKRCNRCREADGPLCRCRGVTAHA